MNKILALIFLAFSLIGAPLNFEYTKKFELKKDEKAYIIFTDSNSKKREVYEFRWTLFDGLNLVLLTKFRQYPKQPILSQRRGLELFKEQILGFTKEENQDSVILYLEFADFKDGVSVLNAYISDKNGRVEVEFEPKEGKYGVN